MLSLELYNFIYSRDIPYEVSPGTQISGPAVIMRRPSHHLSPFPLCNAPSQTLPLLIKIAPHHSTIPPPPIIHRLRIPSRESKRSKEESRTHSAVAPYDAPPTRGAGSRLLRSPFTLKLRVASSSENRRWRVFSFSSLAGLRTWRKERES